MTSDEPGYSEFATDDSDIGDLETDPKETAYYRAKRELAAFKFRLIETVAGDPRLRDEKTGKAPCLAAIVVLTAFVTIDKRSLKPTPAYASLITLMARGNIKSKNTAKLARALLEKHGYLDPTGSKTKDGCVKYHLKNPHGDRVQMHIREAADYWKEKEAERRKNDRRKKQEGQSASVVANIDTTESDRGVKYCQDVVANVEPNYLGADLSDLGYEAKSHLHAGSAFSGNAYAESKGDDPHAPYPATESENETIVFLSTLFEGFELTPATIGYFRRKLLLGELTPAMVEEHRGHLS